ncbi:molybdopterin molybdenumtransferase MoeA, partial [Streptomyces sp. NPDC020807]
AVRRRGAVAPGAVRWDAVGDSTGDVVVTAAARPERLRAAVAALGGRILVDSVAVRPGGAALLAVLPPTVDGRRRLLVGLPGGPLAAVAGAVTLAVPLLRRLGGHAEAVPHRVRAAVALAGHGRDTRLLPVRRVPGGVAPLPFDGPGMLRGLAFAEGLAVVPPGGTPAGGETALLPVAGG